VSAYAERLAVPARWWALAAVAVLALAVVALALPWWLLIAVPAVAAMLLAAVFVTATMHVVVDERGLSAGTARLPWSAIGAVEALDAEAAAALRTRDADPRAHLALRGYVTTAVRVEVEDDSDPTPYWYVSTRHPVALANALTDHAR
jgi:hypothetical protein